MFFVFPCPPTQLRDRPNIAAVLRGWYFARRVILLRLVSAFSHYTHNTVWIATWQTEDDSSANGSKGFAEWFTGSCCSFPPMDAKYDMQERVEENYNVHFPR